MCSLTVYTVSADGTIITVSNLWITLRKSLYILKKSYDAKCNVLTVCTVFWFAQSKTCISIRYVMFYCLSTCVVVRTVRFVTNKWHILYAYNYRFMYCSTNNFLCEVCGNVFYCQLFCFCSIWLWKWQSANFEGVDNFTILFCSCSMSNYKDIILNNVLWKVKSKHRKLVSGYWRKQDIYFYEMERT